MAVDASFAEFLVGDMFFLSVDYTGVHAIARAYVARDQDCLARSAICIMRWESPINGGFSDAVFYTADMQGGEDVRDASAAPSPKFPNNVSQTTHGVSGGLQSWIDLEVYDVVIVRVVVEYSQGRGTKFPIAFADDDTVSGAWR